MIKNELTYMIFVYFVSKSLVETEGFGLLLIVQDVFQTTHSTSFR